LFPKFIWVCKIAFTVKAGTLLIFARRFSQFGIKKAAEQCTDLVIVIVKSGTHKLRQRRKHGFCSCTLEHI
jgi:hypothetical protein